MKALSWKILTALVLFALTVAYITQFILIDGGFNPFELSILLPAIALLGSPVLTYCGWCVRRLRQRKKTWITPMGALYTVVFAYSGALVASLFVGWLIGTVIALLPRFDAPRILSMTFVALGQGACFLILLVCAVIVERWCRIKPDEDNGENNRGATETDRPSGGIPA